MLPIPLRHSVTILSKKSITLFNFFIFKICLIRLCLLSFCHLKLNISSMRAVTLDLPPCLGINSAADDCL